MSNAPENPREETDEIAEREIAERQKQSRKPPGWPDEMERVIDLAVRGFVPWPRPGFLSRRRPNLLNEWVPSIDVFEREGSIVVRADIPGVNREDIEVVVEDDTLIIRGHRQETIESSGENYRCCERATGEFSRAVRLPEGVSPTSIEATYNDGVLEVIIPIPAVRRPTRLRVDVK